MSDNAKHERFKKITGARLEKINDMLRLIGNCSNKNNYSYTDDEIIELFDIIERNVAEAKGRYKTFQKGCGRNNFRYDFEHGYTWAAGFMRNVVRFANRIALICCETGETWSYAELNGEANNLANAMLGAGLKKGDRVMYQMNNCPEFVFIYIACHKIGVTGCPVNTRFAPAQTASVINSVKPKLFFYRSSGDTELALTMAEHSTKPIVISGEKHGRSLYGHTAYEDFAADRNVLEPCPDKDVSIYDETTLFLTSGTTGRQKCAPVTNINEVLSAHDVMIQLNINSSDRILSLMTWSHRGGLHCGGPAAALYAGASVIASEAYEPLKILECIERYKVTFVSGMPKALEKLSAAQEIHDKNLGTLKRIISVGGGISKEGCVRYRQTLCPKLYNGYGTTETFWNAILTPDNMHFYPDSVGAVCVDDDVRIVRTYKGRNAEPEDMVERDNKSCGEIIIKSRSKSAGYYEYGSGTSSRYYKGFLYTNDIGKWNRDGIITVVGRNDDMIICGDEKIYPEEIEEILNRHPKVSDCIVTAVTDKSGKELIAAYVIKSDPTLDFEELDEYCRDNPCLPDDKRPRLYRFKKVIPYTSNDKKQHNKAKQMAANDVRNNMFYRV